MFGMKNLSRILIIFLMCLFPVSASHARESDNPFLEEIPCQMSLHTQGEVNWRGPRSRGYEPETSSVHSETVLIELRNTGGPCEYEIEIVPTDGVARIVNRQGGVNYLLRSDQRPSSLQDGGRLILKGRFTRTGGVAQAGFSVELPAGQYAPAGHYTSDLDVSVYRLEAGLPQINDTRRIRLGADIWPRVSASIGVRADGGVKSASVGLGILRTGLEHQLDFSVYANSAYSITIASDNAGHLKHHKADILIPYTLSLDGSSLGESRLMGQESISFGAIGRLHDLRIRLGRIAPGHTAGVYTDRLVVTIRAEQ